jgi:hypothetical protein
MLLQECRPEDLAMVEGADLEYEVIGSIPHPWIACSVVVAKRELGPTATPRSGALRGLMVSAGRGRAGGQLTEKAKQLLAEGER